MAVTGGSLQNEVPSSGLVDGSNNVFEFDHLPAFVVSDTRTLVPVSNITDEGGNGYTVSGTGPYTVTVSDLAPPVTGIRNFYNA